MYNTTWQSVCMSGYLTQLYLKQSFVIKERQPNTRYGYTCSINRFKNSNYGTNIAEYFPLLWIVLDCELLQKYENYKAFLLLLLNEGLDNSVGLTNIYDLTYTVM